VREHRDIFNSLKEKNGEEAAKKMIFHLQYIENYQMMIPGSQYSLADRTASPPV